MKMKPEMNLREEHIRILELNPSRGAVIGLTLFFLTAALLGYLAWGPNLAAAEEPAAPSAPYASLRQYYLTTSTSSATGAMTACASGYHFASLWEILDTSTLDYNNSLGYNQADSGSGPPTYPGWIQTGRYSSGAAVPGTASCEHWTSNSDALYGTLAKLPVVWIGTYQHLWESWTANCDESHRVWCVED
jgi:hypothetical protein